MNTIHRPVLKNSERKLNSELLKAILLLLWNPEAILKYFFLCVFRWTLLSPRSVTSWTGNTISGTCPWLLTLTTASPLWRTPCYPRPVLLLQPKLEKPEQQIQEKTNKKDVSPSSLRKFYSIFSLIDQSWNDEQPQTCTEKYMSKTNSLTDIN